MTFKSYFAKTVESALAAARSQLGPDALLVTTRKSDVGSGVNGEYEVVFAVDDAADATGITPDAGLGSLAREVRDLRADLEATAALLRRNLPQMRAERPLDPGDERTTFLRASAAGASRPVADADTTAAGLHSDEWLRRTVTCGTHLAGTPAVAVIGPAGAGKTSLLVKIAVRCGMARGRRVRFATADLDRIGAVEQLRAYALLLGTNVTELTCPDDANAIVQNCGERELLCVDTPPLTQHSAGSAEWPAFVTSSEKVATYLVLPAYMRAADCFEWIRSTQAVAPRGILFSRCDETITPGEMVTVCARSGMGIAALSTGPRVPDDLDLTPYNWLAGRLESTAVAAEAAVA